MKPNERSAQGVEGYLLRTVQGTFAFRIYNPNNKEEFKDYAIDHHDLHIKILDDYSSIFEKDLESPPWGYDGYIGYPSRLGRLVQGEARKKPPDA